MQLRTNIFAVILAALAVGCSGGSGQATKGPDPRILVFFDQSGSSRTKQSRVKTTKGLDEVIPFLMDSPITGRSFSGRTYTFAQNLGGGEDLTLDVRTFPDAIRDYQEGGTDRGGRGEMFLLGSNLVPILNEVSREQALKPEFKMAAIIVTDGGFTDDRTELTEALRTLKSKNEEPFLVFAGVTSQASLIRSSRQDQRQDARKILELRQFMENSGYRNFTIMPAEPTGDQRAMARESLEKYFKGSA